MNKKIVIACFGITLIACTTVLYSNYQGSEDLNKAYGNVDIRQSALTFERSGRIVKLNFDEGDLVKKGATLAELNTQELDHQLAINEALMRQAKASLDAMNNGYRAEEISQAHANVKRLKESIKLAVLTYDRVEKLYKTRSTSLQDKDQAFYSLQQLKAQLDEALAKYELLCAGNRAEDIAKAKAQYESTVAQVNYLKYQKNEQSILKGPFDGIIRSKNCEVGDMASSQSAVYELSMTDHKRVRVYLSEKQLSLIKIGKSALVYGVDGKKLQGRVAYISDTAMFTPKTVQTESLRPDLVYEVRVDLEDPDNNLRLGQSVSVDFATRE